MLSLLFEPSEEASEGVTPRSRRTSLFLSSKKSLKRIKGGLVWKENRKENLKNKLSGLMKRQHRVAHSLDRRSLRRPILVLKRGKDGKGDIRQIKVLDRSVNFNKKRKFRVLVRIITWGLGWQCW